MELTKEQLESIIEYLDCYLDFPDFESSGIEDYNTYLKQLSKART